MTLKVGIIGAGGYWAKNYIRIIGEHADCELVAVCDKDNDALFKFYTINQEVPLYTDLSKMIMDKRMDCAIVCTPVSSHYQIVHTLLSNGTHVLCEKAFTKNIEDGEILNYHAGYKNLILAVGQTYYYNSLVQKVKELLDQNYLGDVYYLSMVRVGNSPIRNDCNTFWDLAPHDISMLDYWFGMPTSISVFGKSYFQDGLEDFCVANLELKNNITASIKCSWVNPVKRRSVTIVGSKKMLVLDDIERTLTVYEKDKEEKIDVQYKEPLKEQVNDFIDCILNNKKPKCGGEEGLNVVKVLVAGSKSLKNNSEKFFL